MPKHRNTIFSHGLHPYQWQIHRIDRNKKVLEPIVSLKLLLLLTLHHLPVYAKSISQSLPRLTPKMGFMRADLLSTSLVCDHFHYIINESLEPCDLKDWKSLLLLHLNPFILPPCWITDTFVCAILNTSIICSCFPAY